MSEVNNVINFEDYKHKRKEVNTIGHILACVAEVKLKEEKDKEKAERIRQNINVMKAYFNDGRAK